MTQLVDSPKASPASKSILASDPRGKPVEPPRDEYSSELARIQRSLFPEQMSVVESSEEKFRRSSAHMKRILSKASTNFLNKLLFDQNPEDRILFSKEQAAPETQPGPFLLLQPPMLAFTRSKPQIEALFAGKK